MYQILLISHILGSLTVFGASAYAIWLISRPVGPIHRRVSNNISIVTCIQIITGSVLAIASDQYNLVTFCAQIGTYMGIVLIAQAALWYKLKNNFPFFTNYSTLAVNTLSIILAITFIS